LLIVACARPAVCAGNDVAAGAASPPVRCGRGAVTAEAAGSLRAVAPGCGRRGASGAGASTVAPDYLYSPVESR